MNSVWDSDGPEPWEFEDDWDSQEDRDDYFERLAEHQESVAQYWEERQRARAERVEAHNAGETGTGFNYCRVCGGTGQQFSLLGRHHRQCPACLGTGLFEVDPWD